jgi:hypothetical protein
LAVTEFRTTTRERATSTLPRRPGTETTADDIWRYAQIDRVSNVMRPYLEGAA